MENKQPITCISCGDTGYHKQWCPCKEAPTHRMENKDNLLPLDGKDREINWPDNQEEQVSEKIICQYINEAQDIDWQSKYRKLEEENKKLKMWTSVQGVERLHKDILELKSKNESLQGKIKEAEIKSNKTWERQRKEIFDLQQSYRKQFDWIKEKHPECYKELTEWSKENIK